MVYSWVLGVAVFFAGVLLFLGSTFLAEMVLALLVVVDILVFELSSACPKCPIREINRSLRSCRSTIWSIRPRSQELELKPSGRSARVVSLITRRPAKPIKAFGSARITSPREAKLAITPAIVGWSRRKYKDTRLGKLGQCRTGLGHLHQADPFIHAGSPRCGNNHYWDFALIPLSIERVIFSPTTDPILPPRKRKSITAMLRSFPPIFPMPQTTASSSLVFSRFAQVCPLHDATLEIQRIRWFQILIMFLKVPLSSKDVMRSGAGNGKW